MAVLYRLLGRLLGHPEGGLLCSSVEGLARLSSVAISYRNNFMIDGTLRQNPQRTFVIHCIAT